MLRFDPMPLSAGIATIGSATVIAALGSLLQGVALSTLNTFNRIVFHIWADDMEGQAFAKFLETVCYYAYGPLLAKRLGFMLQNFSYPSMVDFCLRCSAPRNIAGCCEVCKSDGSLVFTADEPPVPFFVRLGRTLLVLRFPHRWCHLFALYTAKCISGKHTDHVKCRGCYTFNAKPKKKCTACKNVMHCSAHWCILPLGIGKCAMCRAECCDQCLSGCPTCAGRSNCYSIGVGCCSDCTKRYLCEECRLEYYESYCVWHAPPRQPVRDDNDGSIRLLCAEHTPGNAKKVKLN